MDLFVSKQDAERRRKLGVEMDAPFWEAAVAAVPDVRELLDQLKTVVPGIEVTARLAVTSPEDRPHVSLDVRHEATLRQLMDVLRRGLKTGADDGSA